MITQKISLDLQLSQRNPVLYAKQGDALQRQVEITFFSGGSAWNVPAGLNKYQVVFCKSDGRGGAYDTMPADEYSATRAYAVGDFCWRLEGETKKYYHCTTAIGSGGEAWNAAHWAEGGEAAVTISGNVATVKIAPEVLTCAGCTAMELQLMSADGDQITSWTWLYQVAQSVETAIRSQDYWNVQSLRQMQVAMLAIEEQLTELRQKRKLSYYYGAIDTSVSFNQDQTASLNDFFPEVEAGDYIVDTNGMIGYVRSVSGSTVTFRNRGDESVLPSTDTTLSIPGKAADAKTTGDKIGELKSAIDVLDALTFEAYDLSNEPTINLTISASTGKWVASLSYYSYYIAVPNHSKCVKIHANADNGTIYALLAATDTKTSGDYPVYAAGSGRTFIPANTSVTVVLPSDCAFIWVSKQLGAKNYEPTLLGFYNDLSHLYNDFSLLTDVYEKKTFPTWEIGSYNYPDGAYYTSSARLRLTQFVGINQAVRSVSVLDGYEFAIFAWNNNSDAYVGAYMSSGNIATSGTMQWVTAFDFSKYPSYKFKLALRNTESPASDMTVSECDNCLFEAGKFASEKQIMGRGITHAEPMSQGQLNVVRRCRQLTDIKWTPAFDIPRISQMAGYGGVNASFFEDVFKAGVEYAGIPYGQATRHASAWGKNTTVGFKPGWTIGLDTFISAVSNPESIVAKDSVYAATGGVHLACFYATICTALCGYAFNLDTYYTTTQIDDAPGMNDLGLVSNLGSLHEIHLADMLHDKATHGAIVTDIVTDEHGNVTHVEISEATTIGNDNWVAQGTLYGGICRRRMWPVEDFTSKWGSYHLYRYDGVDDVPYTKSPYVDTGNEGDTVRVVNFPVMPYMGENFEYVSGHIANTKILTPAYKEGYTDKLRVKKDGVNWNANGTTDYYNVSGQYVEVQFSDVGNYEAYLCQVDDGTEVIKTRACHWKVVAST